MYDIIIGRSKKDREEFGTKASILLGKHYVTMGQTTSLSNKVYLDVASSHVVFVCGKRGSGKCLHGDTLVTLDDGRVLPIKDLVDDENVISLNRNLKIRSAPKEGFYERKVHTLLKLTLRSGKTIKLTPEHPLLKVEGWTPAMKLEKGDRVATPRITSAFGDSDMPEYEVKLLAYMIAEGHIGKKFFFTNKDKTLVKEFREALRDFDDSIELRALDKHQFDIVHRGERKVLGYSIRRDKKGRFSKGTSIEHEKTSFRTLMEKHNLYKKLSKQKIIPEQVLQLPKNKLGLFLSRLFSCDGSLYNSGCWQISYSSSSEKMIRQVQHLLLRFGILSKLRKKNQKLNGKEFETFELVLTSTDVYKFIQEIGFFGKKQRIQSDALEYLAITKRNPNVDTIPKEIWDYYRPENWADVGRKIGYSTPKGLRSSINYGPSRHKLRQIAQADNSERLKRIAESDIFWDEIAEIETLHGDFTVYDITVPEMHNFVANDIIVHNSYTMGVIAEGMGNLPDEMAKRLSVILLDTMGVYWTMKYPNKQDPGLLKQWGIEGKSMDVQIYTPKGYFDEFKSKGIPTDFPFSVKPSELAPEDWCTTFGVGINDPVGVLIMKVVSDLQKTGEDFSIQDIVHALKNSDSADQNTINATVNRFNTAESWGLFSKEGTKLQDLVNPGQVTVLDVSCYASTAGSNYIRALVIGLVSEKLFNARMVARRKEEYEAVHKSMSPFADKQEKQDQPLVWLVIDEAHEFLPREGSTLASEPLITILREGRQPGISLILASQQPGKIHTDVMTQSDTVISHRVTAKLDVEALGMLMQSYMQQGLQKYLNELPREKGAAIIFDDTNERIYPIRVRPRITWHGGGSPTLLTKGDKFP